MQECPTGTPGQVWFRTATPFEYFNDPEKTKEARSPDGSMSTVGDVGYVDADRFLYLTDRATFMIISGGVNIYPQECENLLITHPKVADAAVFGVPNPDLGEEVKAVVQPMPGVAGDETLAQELIAFCGQSLSTEGAALGRLREGTAAAADRQALQAAAARPLLGQQGLAHRLSAHSHARCGPGQAKRRSWTRPPRHCSRDVPSSELPRPRFALPVASPRPRRYRPCKQAAKGRCQGGRACGAYGRSPQWRRYRC